MSIDWKKRDTPTPMLVVVALLVTYAVTAALIAIAEKSWIIGGFALIALLGAIGAAAMKSWSRYNMYVLASGLIGKWAYSIYKANAAGYFDTFETGTAATWSLVPGGLMTLLFLLGCWIVHRQFSVARDPAERLK
jgi:hypothetical protein